MIIPSVSPKSIPFILPINYFRFYKILCTVKEKSYDFFDYVRPNRTKKHKRESGIQEFSEGTTEKGFTPLAET